MYLMTAMSLDLHDDVDIVKIISGAATQAAHTVIILTLLKPSA